jgi:hypothetical protein
MKARLTLLTPALALGAALTACGDDAPTKAQFVAQADAACTAGNTTISGTAKPSIASQVATAAGTAATTTEASTATKANNARLVLSLMEQADAAAGAMGVKAEAYGLTACGS